MVLGVGIDSVTSGATEKRVFLTMLPCRPLKLRGTIMVCMDRTTSEATMGVDNLAVGVVVVIAGERTKPWSTGRPSDRQC